MSSKKPDFSAAQRRFYGGDVDFAHLHHGGEGALRPCGFGVGYGAQKGSRVDLPRNPQAVFAPAAGAGLAAVADDGLPITVSFLLVVGGYLKRKSLALCELGATIEAYAGYAHDGEVHRQHRACLARWVVCRAAKNLAYAGIGEGGCVKLRGFFGAAGIPKANRVFGNLVHGALPLLELGFGHASTEGQPSLGVGSALSGFLFAAKLIAAQAGFSA